ncbi:hypothetical protein BGZ80_008405, partial [Entomortierella chlamydospora]
KDTVKRPGTKSTPSNNNKRRKGSSSKPTTEPTIALDPYMNPQMQSRVKRYNELDQHGFWRLARGRAVETVLFECSLKGRASFKSLFTDLEWAEISQFNKFDLPALPRSTVEYIKEVQSALVSGKHAVSVPVPEIRFSCDQILKSLLS